MGAVRAVRPVLIRGPAVLSVSGGATSAMMWRRVLDAHGGKLPPDVRPVFCNTGKEFPATLDFLRECETRWECPIVWVERAPGDTFREVDYATASRDGEPFEQLIRERRYLPNPSVRFCTSALKVEVSQRWARAQGWEAWTDVVGLRADEPARVAKRRAANATDEERTVVCPLADAGITREDVDRWWASQPFRLDLKRGESNCDLCFMKGWLWRSAGLWDGPETLRDASESVYTKEPMVDVGAWDIGAGAGRRLYRLGSRLSPPSEQGCERVRPAGAPSVPIFSWAMPRV